MKFYGIFSILLTLVNYAIVRTCYTLERYNGS